MSASNGPTRRIVTGFGPTGKSCIVEDGPAPTFRHLENRPGGTLANLWVTGQAPSSIEAPDGSGGWQTLHPPPGGSVIRVMDIPPEPQLDELDESARRAFVSSPFSDRNKVSSDTSRHPRMHTTDTIDYAVCLSGEIYAVMEEDETLMRAGDVLIQRGTNHAWANRSKDVCRMMFILIDAKHE